MKALGAFVNDRDAYLDCWPGSSLWALEYAVDCELKCG